MLCRRVLEPCVQRFRDFYLDRGHGSKVLPMFSVGGSGRFLMEERGFGTLPINDLRQGKTALGMTLNHAEERSVVGLL